MSGKIFDIFDEYTALCAKKKITRTGYTQNWNWFKIYVFSNEEVDLVEELKKLNALLVSHNMSEYGNFSVCFNRSLLPDTAFAFLSKKKKEK